MKQPAATRMLRKVVSIDAYDAFLNVLSSAPLMA
jgi:hypothetical protein